MSQTNSQNNDIEALQREVQQLKNEIKRLTEENQANKEKSRELTFYNPDDYVDHSIISQGYSSIYKLVYEREPPKFVKKELLQTDFKTLRNFISECELLFRFQHPCIIHVYSVNFGDENHKASMILKLEKTSLENAIRNNELSNEDKNRITVEIVLGMRYIHKNNFMHRDLKPSHILLSKKNHARISNLSLAKEEKPGESREAGIGTLKFMAPEVLNEEDNYTRKIDVYSFGIILIYIVTGEYPAFTLRSVMSGQPPALPENIVKWTRELITSCLSFEPEKRPSFDEIFGIMKENNFNLFSDSKGRNLMGKQLDMKKEIESRIKKIETFELNNQ